MDDKPDELLDSLPLEVLLALHEAAADPTAEGQERARQRAADAGFHIECMGGGPRRVDREPIPMEEAPEGLEGLALRFDR